MAHFSVKQRKPFKKSFWPSLRQSRQTASRCLATPLLLYCSRLLDTPALRRTATIVRNRGHVLDMGNVQPGSRERTNRGFAPRSRPFDTNFDRFHPVLVSRHASGGHGGLLRSVGSSLARSFEPDGPRGRPTDRAPVRGRDRHNRVIKSRLNTGQAMRHYPALTLFLELFLAL